MIEGKGLAKTRSDRVRSRRIRQEHNEKNRASNSYKHMAAKPAVITRSGIGTPVFQRVNTRVKRQISLPLNRTGAELLIPSLPIVKIGWRLLSG